MVVAAACRAVLEQRVPYDVSSFRGLSWKCYAEDLEPQHKARWVIPPQPADRELTIEAFIPSILPDTGNFARKHVPFLSFPSIASSTDRMAKIVNTQDEFETDIANSNLPHYN